LGGGDVVVVDFPGVAGIKRRPAVVLSSDEYHGVRLDVIVGLVTSQTGTLGPTDHLLRDWAAAGLHVPSVFRCFLVTLPRPSQQFVIGHLSSNDWQAVCDCVKRSLVPLSDQTA
jgi:mRNA interferase MazF